MERFTEFGKRNDIIYRKTIRRSVDIALRKINKNKCKTKYKSRDSYNRGV